MSFSNYIFAATSSFSPSLRLTSCSLIKVKFNVCSPPVEVPPVGNQLLLVHGSLCSQRIKPQQISAIFPLNDDTCGQFAAADGDTKICSFPQDLRAQARPWAKFYQRFTRNFKDRVRGKPK